METEVRVEKQQIAKRKRAWFSVNTIPWFMGFSNDLMFYIAINTLFLTAAKKLKCFSNFIFYNCALFILHTFTKTIS